MKAYVWGNNQIVTVAENKTEAVKKAISRLTGHVELVKTVINTDPIEIPENGTRILYTNWAIS